MLIQKLVRHDSIIASRRLVVVFCNTIEGEAAAGPTGPGQQDDRRLPQGPLFGAAQGVRALCRALP